MWDRTLSNWKDYESAGSSFVSARTRVQYTEKNRVKELRRSIRCLSRRSLFDIFLLHSFLFLFSISENFTSRIGSTRSFRLYPRFKSRRRRTGHESRYSSRPSSSSSPRPSAIDRLHRLSSRRRSDLRSLDDLTDLGCRTTRRVRDGPDWRNFGSPTLRHSCPFQLVGTRGRGFHRREPFSCLHDRSSYLQSKSY